jgi:hypothetical protein
MVKASDLIKTQKERENIKYKTFSKIYNKIIKKITLASSCNYYYIWYEIPNFIMGCPLYNINECKTVIIDKLKHNEFDIEEYEPNILLVKWFK